MSNHQFSRRTLLRGLGVTMALPWLESLAVWGDEPAGAAAGQRGARAAGRAVLRQRLSQQGVVGQGRRQARWSSARCSRRWPTSARRCSSSAACTTHEALKGNIHSSQTGNLLSGAPLASGGEIRSGTSIDQLLAQQLRPLDQGAEPGAGLREVEPVGPQELLDALQLAHLVELADDADAAGAVSRAGLRPAVQGRSAARRQERARRRAGRRQRLPPADQHDRPAQARRVPRLGPRRRAAHRAGRQAGRAARLAADARQARTSRARPTAFRRTSPTTCG